jgi:WD40 repeat protein
LWDLARAEGFNSYHHGYATMAVSFSKDSRYLASVARDQVAGADGTKQPQHTVALWEISGRTLRQLTNTPFRGRSHNSVVTFATDGASLVVGDLDNRNIEIRSIPSLELITRLKGYPPILTPDGRSVIYGSGTNLFRRDGAPGSNTADTVIGTHPHIKGSARWALSPNGQTIAFVRGDGTRTLHFWNVGSQRLLGTVAERHEADVYGLEFSPNGRWLASVASDRQVGIWDVGRQRLHKFLLGHSGDLFGVCFSPDGRRLATGGEDGMVRLWDTDTWQEVAALHARANINSVAFSPNGQWLAAAAQDGTVRLWHAPNIEEIETETKVTKSK